LPTALFVAFEILALAAADITRFFPPVVLPLLLTVALPLLLAVVFTVAVHTA